jgi:hypothetical protein
MQIPIKGRHFHGVIQVIGAQALRGHNLLASAAAPVEARISAPSVPILMEPTLRRYSPLARLSTVVNGNLKDDRSPTRLKDDAALRGNPLRVHLSAPFAFPDSLSAKDHSSSAREASSPLEESESLTIFCTDLTNWKSRQCYDHAVVGPLTLPVTRECIRE